MKEGQKRQKTEIRPQNITSPPPLSHTHTCSFSKQNETITTPTTRNRRNRIHFARSEKADITATHPAHSNHSSQRFLGQYFAWCHAGAVLSSRPASVSTTDETTGNGSRNTGFRVLSEEQKCLRNTNASATPRTYFMVATAMGTGRDMLSCPRFFKCK